MMIYCLSNALFFLKLRRFLENEIHKTSLKMMEGDMVRKKYDVILDMLKKVSKCMGSQNKSEHKISSWGGGNLNNKKFARRIEIAGKFCKREAKMGKRMKKRDLPKSLLSFYLCSSQLTGLGCTFQFIPTTDLGLYTTAWIA